MNRATMACWLGLGAVAAVLSGCCSSVDARFWRLRDASGEAIYAVDTESVPLERIRGSVTFLDRTGRSVRGDQAQVERQITSAEWQSETSGADWRVQYCPRMLKCWADAVPR